MTQALKTKMKSTPDPVEGMGQFMGAMITDMVTAEAIGAGFARLFSAGGKVTPTVKVEVPKVVKAEPPAPNPGSKGGPTAGKKFTPKQKQAAVEANKAKYNGKTVCESCKTNTVAATRDKKGVSPPANRTEIDHIYPRSKGGNTTPENAQVLCRTCNRGKSDKVTTQ